MWRHCRKFVAVGNNVIFAFFFHFRFYLILPFIKNKEISNFRENILLISKHYTRCAHAGIWFWTFCFFRTEAGLKVCQSGSHLLDSEFTKGPCFVNCNQGDNWKRVKNYFWYSRKCIVGRVGTGFDQNFDIWNQTKNILIFQFIKDDYHFAIKTDKCFSLP